MFEKWDENKAKAMIKALNYAFEIITRYDGTDIYVLRDGSPEWMTTVIRNFHGSLMPDDLTYSVARSILLHLEEETTDDYRYKTLASIGHRMEPEFRTAALYDFLLQFSEYEQYVIYYIRNNPRPELFNAMQHAYSRFLVDKTVEMLQALEKVMDEYEPEESEEEVDE